MSSPPPPPRPYCSVFIAVSADGYIARTDGATEWLAIVHQEGEDYGYQKFIDTVDALVVGRKTYDVALGFDSWPYAGKRCIVLTHRPSTAQHDEEFFADGPLALVEELGRQGVRHVYVDGGDVIQQFLAVRLIDTMTISVIPVLLGDGIPLFADGAPEQKLTLLEAQSWPSGLVQMRYRIGEPPAAG